MSPAPRQIGLHEGQSGGWEVEGAPNRAHDGQMDGESVDPVVSRRMSVIRGRDTRPELAIRSILHRSGLRFRVNYRAIAGSRRTVDIAFPRRRIAVFVDGCFWHGCPVHFVVPRTRTEYWVSKIDGNRARDVDSTQTLSDEGWTVLRYWEHQDPDAAARDITTRMTE